MKRLLGFIIAGTGIAHFLKPELFVGITKPAFPDNTEQAIQTNGAIETAIGVAFILKSTRKLGAIGLLAYGGWLGYNAANAGK